MKIKINRNILWSRILIEQLARLGVENICISPGSRSTSLTYAAAKNKKIRTHIFVDERSSCFFALGIAKQSNTPVAVITTSGTAVAELYPAIVEAYKTRTPLIILTADRPEYLRDKGANQTINQNDIFRNHIRLFSELPLPALSKQKIENLKKNLIKAYQTSKQLNPGPVHLNIPFEKPFEPESFTDTINGGLLKSLWKFNKPDSIKPSVLNRKDSAAVNSIYKKVITKRRGIIFCGGGVYSSALINQINTLSKAAGYPVIADASAGLRFGNGMHHRILENFNSLSRSSNFIRHYDPEIIIQFGMAPTSIAMLEFYKKSEAEKFLVNEHGDWMDPSSTASLLVKCSPLSFCTALAKKLKGYKVSRGWFNELKVLNLLAARLKDNVINGASFPFEGRIVNEIVSSLPGKCALFIANSLPVRDFDSYSPVSEKNITVFTNRGASGIDGLISTSLGIASQSGHPVFLVTGDLAFFHDLNALAAANRLALPLQIILINNNGGGIFEHLPIAKHRDVVETYFKTPLNLNFERIVDGYGCSYKLIKNWTDLRKQIKRFGANNSIEVLEIKTDSLESYRLRNDYLRELETIIE